MMRCAIYGAGSLGTVLGAYLSRAGVPVELVNRNRAHVEALRKGGAHITGTVEFTTPVRAIYPEEMQGIYDVIFLMTKQLHNAEVVAFLAPMLGPSGVIVTMQNGIPEPGIAEIVGEAHTMGCVVEWGATLTAPGESRLTSSPDSLSFHIGGTDDGSAAAAGAYVPGGAGREPARRALVEIAHQRDLFWPRDGDRWLLRRCQ